MNLLKYFIILFFGLFFIQGEFIAQQRITERGTSTFRKVGVHRGNQVRTVFSNFGVIAQPGSEGPRGSWKFDANGYVGDVSPLVGVRLPIRDYINASSDTLDGITDTIFSVIITPVDRPGGGESGLGKAWGFEPIPGFADPILDELGKGVAMSHLPETWPPFWPDHPDWTYSGAPIIQDGIDITPQVDWNGFFGRAQFNADQESYFWMDDNNDEEWFNRHAFLPDSMDLNRRGAALQVNIRGLQWSNFLAQNVVFWLYNILNDGTETYDQVAFGTLVGTYVGVETPEWNDDASFFDVRDAITYTWDFDKFISPAANPQWLPDPSAVGYIFYAFLESPGNPFDGIDNDGDNENFTISAPFFEASDFLARTIEPGEKIILIDKETFNRTEFSVGSDTITVYSLGVPFFIEPGVTEVVEGNTDAATGSVFANATDGIDNDLDGLIDENSQVHYRQFKKTPEGIVLIDTLNPVQYKDYINNIGLLDPMVDEARDDLIDNDRDWNIEFDDVGQDGKPNTNDFGEGDGMPTTGEPNFDQTDVNESDQLGLTSFQYFVPAGDITMSNDINMWSRMQPGFYDVPSSIVGNVAIRGEDGDFIFGSGYFPLLPGKTQRFSLALGFGEDLNGAIKTKRVAQIIFDANYNFPRPPEKPTMTAVPGDGKVTLYWDRVAESSVDPTLKVQDFEGYKVYKGTDPDFTDALQISDADGTKVLWAPEFQVDLDNGIQGIFVPSPELYELTNGVPYKLGNDSGIQNFFVDNDVINGRTYYYAVVAYDRGDASKDVFPSENSKFISKDALGNISTDINTAALIPNPPVAGYVPPPSGEELDRISGNSTSTVFMEVIDPFEIQDSSYAVEFNDSLVEGVSIAYSYNVINQGSGQFVLTDAPMSPDNGVVFNGVRLSMDTTYQNIGSIGLNTNDQVTYWNTRDPNDLGFQVSQFTFPSAGIFGIKDPRDYVLAFTDEYADSSDKLDQIFGPNAPPARLVNFQVYDVTDQSNPVRIPFAFTEASSFRPDTLSHLDQITLAIEDASEVTWKIVMIDPDSTANVPKGGDSLFISIVKPFAATDEFQFSTMKSAYSVNDAREQLNKITVVPNPYVVTNVFEQPLPPTVRGRGERVIYFMNLPPASTIRIFSSAGDLIRTLKHDGNLESGTVQWDVRTEEGLDVAYGVYFYVVEVEGLSDKKMGKIGIIK
jgi:hypothetical protein